MDSRGHIRLTDFGLAKIMEDESRTVKKENEIFLIYFLKAYILWYT